MGGQHGYMTLVSQFSGMSALPQTRSAAMMSRNGNEHIYLIVTNKIINGFVKIVHTYKIKLIIIVAEHTP